MKDKIVGTMAAFVTVNYAYALSQCPSNVEHCGMNPFAPLVVGFAQVCSERRPDYAKDYEAAVTAFFTGQTKEYAQLSRNTEFQKQIEEARKVAASMSQAEIESECATLLSKGKNNTPPDVVKK